MLLLEQDCVDEMTGESAGENVEKMNDCYL